MTLAYRYGCKPRKGILAHDMAPKSPEIPPLFKADTATVSFDAAKAGKLSRGFQDCERIGSFEKSGVRAALGTPQGSKRQASRVHTGAPGGFEGGVHIYVRDQEGGQRGVDIYDPRGRGG